MDRDHLDIHVVPTAVVLVLDARVREMDLHIDIRQVVLAGPFFDLARVTVGVAVVVVAVAIALLQPPLVSALELAVQDDAIDARAALFQPLGLTFEGPIDLDVVSSSRSRLTPA